MSADSPKSGFDSVDYWKARHDQYGSDPRGVGNVVFDSERNQQIYDTAVRQFGALVAYLGHGEGDRVLDLGCGIGKIAPAFLQAGCSYTGVDVSDTAIEIAREANPEGSFAVANIAELPFEGPYEMILERTVFIHLVEDDYWQSVLGEVKRLLAPGGLFVLQDHVPQTEEEAGRKVDHVRKRLYSEYETALAAVGLAFDPDGVAAARAALPGLSPNTHFIRHGN